MADRAQVTSLLAQALSTGEGRPLEDYLTANSHLPGPRGNLELLDAFAAAVGDLAVAAPAAVSALAALLNRWACSPAPVTEPGVMLSCASAISRGQLAASAPDQWAEQFIGLERAARDERWRVREMVAAGLQRMLKADWDRTCASLLAWATSPDPLVVRAAVAGVAEPPLLKPMQRADAALAIQRRAVEQLKAIPDSDRKSEPARTLRQALGYTISVVVVGTPDNGLGLLAEMARSQDADVRWVVAENLKKNRLKPWPDRVAQIRAELDTAAGAL